MLFRSEVPVVDTGFWALTFLSLELLASTDCREQIQVTQEIFKEGDPLNVGIFYTTGLPPYGAAE